MPNRNKSSQIFDCRHNFTANFAYKHSFWFETRPWDVFLKSVGCVGAPGSSYLVVNRRNGELSVEPPFCNAVACSGTFPKRSVLSFERRARHKTQTRWPLKAFGRETACFRFEVVLATHKISGQVLSESLMISGSMTTECDF